METASVHFKYSGEMFVKGIGVPHGTLGETS